MVYGPCGFKGTICIPVIHKGVMGSEISGWPIVLLLSIYNIPCTIYFKILTIRTGSLKFHSAKFPCHITLFDGVTLVVQLFTTCQGNFQLCQPLIIDE
jgi:hypothetical protein